MFSKSGKKLHHILCFNFSLNIEIATLNKYQNSNDLAKLYVEIWPQPKNRGYLMVRQCSKNLSHLLKILFLFSNISNNFERFFIYFHCLRLTAKKRVLVNFYRKVKLA